MLSNESLITIISVLTVVIGFITILFAAYSHSVNTFKGRSSNYQVALESAYLGLMNIYSSDSIEKERKAKEFISTIYERGINTTLLINEHKKFLELCNMLSSNTSFADIEESLDSLAVRIEKLYWENYTEEYYEVIISGNWNEQLKLKLYWSFYKISGSLTNMINFVFIAFPLTLLLLSLVSILPFYQENVSLYNSYIAKGMVAFMLITIIVSIAAHYINNYYKRIIRKYQQNIEGKTFIADKL